MLSNYAMKITDDTIKYKYVHRHILFGNEIYLKYKCLIFSVCLQPAGFTLLVSEIGINRSQQ